MSTDIPPAEDATTVKPDNQFNDIAREVPADPEAAGVPAQKPSAPHAVSPDNFHAESAPEALSPDDFHNDSAPEAVSPDNFHVTSDPEG